MGQNGAIKWKKKIAQLSYNVENTDARTENLFSYNSLIQR